METAFDVGVLLVVGFVGGAIGGALGGRLAAGLWLEKTRLEAERAKLRIPFLNGVWRPPEPLDGLGPRR